MSSIVQSHIETDEVLGKPLRGDFSRAFRDWVRTRLFSKALLSGPDDASSVL